MINPDRTKPRTQLRAVSNSTPTQSSPSLPFFFFLFLRFVFTPMKFSTFFITDRWRSVQTLPPHGLTCCHGLQRLHLWLNPIWLPSPLLFFYTLKNGFFFILLSISKTKIIIYTSISTICNCSSCSYLPRKRIRITTWNEIFPKCRKQF